MEFKNWEGETLVGMWLITYKIDGVQAINRGELVTKGGNTLYNIPKGKKKFEIAEIFCGSWNKTMSIVRASKSSRRLVRPDEIYPLYPKIDNRLIVGFFNNPSPALIRIAFNQAIANEYEGLVLRNLKTSEFIKVKPTYSVDIKITGWVEGKGRLTGKLGKFTAEEGDVGTGFTDEMRDFFWKIKEKLLGKYMEVEAMEITNIGKLRHPRFIRLRLDK